MTDEDSMVDMPPAAVDEEAGTSGPIPSRPRVSRVSEAHSVPPSVERPAGDAPHAADGEVTRIVPSGSLELVGRGAHDVTVGSLSIRQGGVNIANADTIDVRQGGITRAEGRDISVVQGGVAVARAERVSVGMGAIGLALGRRVEVSRGFARSVVAQDVRIAQGGARTVIAGRASFDRSSGALVVLAAKAEGNVRTLLDWRGALALGAAFGVVVGLVRRIRR